VRAEPHRRPGGGRFLAATATLALVLAACGSETTPAADGTTDPGDATPTAQDGPGPTAAPTPSGTGSETPAADEYQASAVTSAVAIAPDGSTFAPADFAGKHVFVETFATWCSKCRAQLGDTNIAAGQAGDDAVFLILSVETDLDPAVLPDYAARNGFDNLAHFGVLTDESLAAFVDEFGRSIANAPSTPKFTIAPDGTLSELTTGFESVEEILAQLPA